MTKDGALKLALEALEGNPISHAGLVNTKQAITAIKEALAQPEPEYVLPGGGYVPPIPLAPPQEPHQCRGIPRKGCNYLTACGHVCNKCGQIHHAHLLVDMLEPPQRTWVGLTEEEREEIENTPFSQNDWLWFYTQAIEDKLKEKNL